jgi:NAD-dependent DNA ligase
MVTETSESREAGPQEVPLPTNCPYCKSPLKAKSFQNGTTELKCTKPNPEGQVIAHALTFYYKKS